MLRIVPTCCIVRTALPCVARAACVLPHARYALHGASAAYAAVHRRRACTSQVIECTACSGMCNMQRSPDHCASEAQRWNPFADAHFPEQSRFHRFHGRWHASSRQRNDLRPQHCRARLPLPCLRFAALRECYLVIGWELLP
jgi:hypothetical protein